MPHIEFEKGFPGILGPMRFSPHTAEPMNALANALMCSDEGLSRGERELKEPTIDNFSSAANRRVEVIVR